MGRKTWDSLPLRRRPLPDRINVVLSRDEAFAKTVPDSVYVAPSMKHALHWINAPDRIGTVGQIWIIGGAGVYNECMKMPECQEIYCTSIDQDFECDVFWNGVDKSNFVLDEDYSLYQEEKGVTYCLQRWIRAPHPEIAYLQLAANIITDGIERSDRTGVGTISKFGAQIRFDLRRGFPLLTTKKVFWKGIKEELLWFISGSTNAKRLSDIGVRIWDENGTREFLDGRGLTSYPEGHLGPVYGFQWRHFGADYTNADDDYTGKGFDQLVDCIQQIRTNPDSRRIIMSAWNAKDISKMALPPCHVMCQFYVENGLLSCHLYQRSADM